MFQNTTQYFYRNDSRRKIFYALCNRFCRIRKTAAVGWNHNQIVVFFRKKNARHKIAVRIFGNGKYGLRNHRFQIFCRDVEKWHILRLFDRRKFIACDAFQLKFYFFCNGRNRYLYVFLFELDFTLRRRCEYTHKLIAIYRRRSFFLYVDRNFC